MAKSTRAAAISSTLVPSTLASSSSADVPVIELTDDQLELVQQPVQDVLDHVLRVLEAGDGSDVLWSLGGLEGTEDGQASTILGAAQKEIETVLSTVAPSRPLFIPLPSLAKTASATLHPIQKLNLVLCFFALQRLSAPSPDADGWSPGESSLVCELRDGVWREVMSLFLAAGLEDSKDEEEGEDNIAKAIRGGKKESEMRLAALRERLEVLLNVCSLAYTVLQSPSSTSATQDDDHRLAEIFLPTFLGSNDQVAPPGKQKGRGAIFRSRREKELCLGIWSELVEEREGELQRLPMPDLQLRYNANVVLNDLLNYLMHNVWIPFSVDHKGTELAPPTSFDFLESQAEGILLTAPYVASLASAGQEPSDEEDDEQIDHDLLILQDILADASAAVDEPEQRPSSKRSGKGKERAVEEQEEQVDELTEFVIDPSLSGYDQGEPQEDQEGGVSQESISVSLAEDIWEQWRKAGGVTGGFELHHDPQQDSEYIDNDEAAEAEHIVDPQLSLPSAPSSATPAKQPARKKRKRASSFQGPAEDEFRPPAHALELQDEPFAPEPVPATLEGVKQKKPRRPYDPLAPVKRKEISGRGNSTTSAKGYLYYQNRNDTGRRPWTEAEDKCLLEAMEHNEGQKLLWSTIIKQHGPQGSVDHVLAERNSVACKDRARNLKVLMVREKKDMPSSLDVITLPKRHRLAKSNVSNEDEQAAINLQHLMTQSHSHSQEHSPVAGPSHVQEETHAQELEGAGTEEGHGHEMEVDVALLDGSAERGH